MNGNAIISSLISLVVFLLLVIYLLHRRMAERSIQMSGHIKELEASTQRNEAFIRALPDLFFVIDRNGLYLDCSAPNSQLLKAPVEGLIGHYITEIFEPALVEKFMTAVSEALDDGVVPVVEYELDVPAGHRHFECRIVALDREKALYIARDVTRVFKHEEAVLASLREKEILLREIHHRVKNNLQVISSLVSLQTDLFSSPQDRHLMQETQQRIQSMAQLHELLYQSSDFQSINLNEYISGILAELMIEYNSVGGRIRVVQSIADICVSLEVALPVGLIVNELLSNSLKYAFPASQGGLLEITAVKIGERITLTVSDDGIGLPAGLSISGGSSLGFLLVDSLTGQLGGTVTHLNDAGTRIQLDFPVRMIPGPAISVDN